MPLYDVNTIITRSLYLGLITIVLFVIYGIYIKVKFQNKNLEEKLKTARDLKNKNVSMLSPTYVILESRILNQLGRAQDALDSLETVDISKYFDKVSYYIAKADTLIELGKLEAAEDIVAVIGSDATSNRISFKYEHYMVMAKLCLANKNDQEADFYIKKMKIFSFRDFRYVLLTAKYYLLIGDYPTAMQKLSYIIKECKDDYFVQTANGLMSTIPKTIGIN